MSRYPTEIEIEIAEYLADSDNIHEEFEWLLLHIDESFKNKLWNDAKEWKKKKEETNE